MSVGYWSNPSLEIYPVHGFHPGRTRFRSRFRRKMADWLVTIEAERDKKNSSNDKHPRQNRIGTITTRISRSNPNISRRLLECDGNKGIKRHPGCWTETTTAAIGISRRGRAVIARPRLYRFVSPVTPKCRCDIT